MQLKELTDCTKIMPEKLLMCKIGQDVAKLDLFVEVIQIFAEEQICKKS